MYKKIGNVYKLFKDEENVISLDNHKQIKKYRVYIEHVEAVLKITNITIKGFEYFKVYSPVVEMLKTLKEQKQVLEAHLTELRKKVV